MKIGVLVSGTGRNLQALLEGERAGTLGPATIVCVISSRAEAPALTRATNAGKPALFLDPHGYATRQAFEDELLRLLESQGAEWVILAGFMRVLTGHFLRHFPDRVINIHPSLLPAFPGTSAQRQALEHGVKVSGCTVHLVDEGIDTGPILAQAAVPVLADDDVSRLADRILNEEIRLLPQVVAEIAAGHIERRRRTAWIKR